MFSNRNLFFSNPIGLQSSTRRVEDPEERQERLQLKVRPLITVFLQKLELFMWKNHAVDYFSSQFFQFFPDDDGRDESPSSHMQVKYCFDFPIIIVLFLIALICRCLFFLLALYEVCGCSDIRQCSINLESALGLPLMTTPHLNDDVWRLPDLLDLRWSPFRPSRQQSRSWILVKCIMCCALLLCCDLVCQTSWHST